MSLFATPFLESLREKHGDATRWPGALADPEDASVRMRIEQSLAMLLPDVRERVGAMLTSESLRDLFLGRAVLWGASLAGLTGAVVTDVLSNGVLEVDNPGGEPSLLVPLVFHTGDAAPGAPEVVSKLIRALEATFSPRPFALHIRQPLARDFDEEAVTRAVHLWLNAVDKGEWRGRHAVYDDDRISIELTLLETSHGDDEPCMRFFIGPSVALDRLATVDHHLQVAAGQIEPHGLPWVALLTASPNWGITRGYRCQLLYGTPDEVTTERKGGTAEYVARYSDDRYALFADPQFRRLASVWWGEPSVHDPLGVLGHAHDNPWYQGPELPAFPGTRYRWAGLDTWGGRKRRAMTWEGSEPTVWEETTWSP